MRRITPIIVYMTIFLTLISCRRTENIIVDSVEMSEFLLLKTPCYIVKEELMYEYDIHRDQFSFNYARNCFRFFTPNQESFLCCVLSPIPKKEGEMTQVRIIFGDKEKRNESILYSTWFPLLPGRAQEELARVLSHREVLREPLYG